MIIQDQELRQDIGHVGSGNMLLTEIFNNPLNDSMPYNVADDVHFHMLNDEPFYRHHYMPCMDKIRSEHNEKVIQGHLMPMIDKCLNHYCLKYNLDKTPDELMNPQERADLANKVLDHERNPKEELPDATKTTI